MASVYIDEDEGKVFIHLLQAEGHVVRHARTTPGMSGASDGHQLLFAAQHGSALLTHKGKDFLLLHDAWRGSVSKSKMWMFSAIRSGRTDFGMAEIRRSSSCGHPLAFVISCVISALHAFDPYRQRAAVCGLTASACPPSSAAARRSPAGA